MVLNKNRNKNGFSLIELIAVMLLLAVLALTVLPRFINFKEDAGKATVLATASSFKDALKLVRTKWILAGQPNPSGNSSISYGDAEIKLRKGYPYSVNDIDDDNEDFTDFFSGVSPWDASTKRCYALFNTLLTNPPTSTYSDNAEELRNNTFYVFYYDIRQVDLPADTNNLGGSNACIYYLVSNLNLNEPIEAQLINTNTQLSGFAYNPSYGYAFSFYNGFNGFYGH